MSAADVCACGACRSLSTRVGAYLAAIRSRSQREARRTAAAARIAAQRCEAAHLEPQGPGRVRTGAGK